MNKFVVFLSIIIFSTSTLWSADYTFVSIDKLIEQEVGRLIIPEVYKKLGMEVEITPLPGRRAQQEATTGKKDGEIMRIWTYGENNPTMIRVPVPYYSLETMAFVKKGSGIKINSKEDLTKYKVVKVRGVKHTDNITKGIEGVHTINNSEQLMKFLEADRAEVALTNTVDGLLTLKKLGITDIVPMDKPLKKLELFHYIHEKHRDLVMKVDKVLKGLKDSGELDKIVKKAEAKIIGN